MNSEQLYTILREQGPRYCTDAQLVASISGCSANAAQSLLSQYSINMLGVLSKDNFKDHGITEKQGLRLVAAMNLHTRLTPATASISCSRDAYAAILPKLENLDHEEFWVMCVNQKNRVIRTERIATGGIAAVIVDLRLMANIAVSTPTCVGLILAHNHPSGGIEPSGPDREITRKAYQGLKILDITVLDHIIVGEFGKYYSFADNGQLS